MTAEKISELRKFVSDKKNDMVELEKLLTGIPALAPECGGQGELKKAEALIQWLKNAGFTDIQRIDAPDSRVESGIRPNIIVTIPGESDEYTIWTMAHLDVVPPGDLSLWSSDPWTVVEKDGKLFGRGVEDNQQGLVSSVFAGLAFVKNGVKPAHTVKLLFMADEENGSAFGIIWLLNNKNLFNKNDIILIPDGGDSEGKTIEIAEKNILWLKVHVKGQQVHGSRPDLGKNACLAGSDLALSLNGLEKVFSARNKMFTPDYSTFSPTMRFRNVDGVNIIPGEDVFCMDCRILPEYTIDSVLAQVEELCDECEKKYGVEVCYEILQKSESPATSENSLVVKKLSESLKAVHGMDAELIGIGGGTVAAEFRRLGYSCAVWSTLDECAHMPDEYCKIENIAKDAETLVHLFAV